MAATKAATKAADAKPARARKSALVLPTYSLKNVKTGESLFVRVDTEIVQKEDFDHATGERKMDKKTKEPAFLYLVQVTDLDTGERGEMVLPCIILHAFQQAGKVAGRSFELVKGESTTGKATKWEVYEID